jgi:predicted metal-binding protein
MKRVAIIRCRNAELVCTGAGCLHAFNRGEGAFASYGGEALELVAYLSCNGCQGVEDQGPFDQGVFTPLALQPDLLAKLERLERERVDCVHLGICCWNRQGEECPAMVELTGELQRRGMNVVKGTHL